MKIEKPISVSDIIDHDMAVKCGQDVGEVMRRNFLLLDTTRPRDGYWLSYQCEMAIKLARAALTLKENDDVG